MSTSFTNLLEGPPPALLPDDSEARERLRSADAAAVAAEFPAFSTTWADLAGKALASGDPVSAYAFARTGYHRGLDALRKIGWKGQGRVSWSHEPNRGFLRSLHLLGRAAESIGETDEAKRCADFLHECDPAAAEELRKSA